MSRRVRQCHGVAKYKGLATVNTCSYTLIARNPPAVAVKIAVKTVPLRGTKLGTKRPL